VFDDAASAFAHGNWRIPIRNLSMVHALVSDLTTYLARYRYTKLLGEKWSFYSLFSEFSTAWVVHSQHLSCRYSHDVRHFGVYPEQ